MTFSHATRLLPSAAFRRTYDARRHNVARFPVAAMLHQTALIFLRRTALICLWPVAAAQGQTARTSGDSPPADSVPTPTHAVRWGSGLSAGSLRFGDGAREQAVSASLVARLWNTVDVLLNPTYASATAADSISGSTVIHGRTARGMTALPVHVGVTHAFDQPWTPTIGAGVGFAVPTGDSSGVGSSHAGYGVRVELAVSPSDRFDMAMGVSHALNDAYAAGLGSSSPTNLSIGTSYGVGAARVSMEYSGDVATAATGFDAAQSIGGGVSVPLHGNVALTLDGVTGLTSGAPSWSFTVGVGVTPAGVAEVALSPLSRAGRAFGLGRTLSKSKATTSRGVGGGKRRVP